MRYIEDEDGVAKLLCKKCEEYSPLEDFPICEKCRYGRMYVCKECFNQKRRNERTPAVPNRDVVNEWFRNMGYEIGGEKSIHEQFMERVQLKRLNMKKK